MTSTHAEASNTLLTAMGNPACDSDQLWLNPEISFHYTSVFQVIIQIPYAISFHPFHDTCLKEDRWRRATLYDSTGEEGVCRGTPEGLPVGLSFLVGSPVECRPRGLESGWTPAFTRDIRLCAQFILTIAAGGGRGYDPYPGHKESEVQRGSMTNGKVASKWHR